MRVMFHVDTGFPVFFAAQGTVGPAHGLRTEQWSGNLGTDAAESFQ